MNELEIGPMKMTVEGDNAPYARSLEEAKGMLNRFGGHVQQTNVQLQNYAAQSANSFRSLWSITIASLATFGTGVFARSAFREWTLAENAVIQLNATLRANGRDVASLSEEYMQWGSAIQATTRMGDEAAFLLLKTAESYQLTGAAAKQAASDAIALAAVNDSNAESMMRITTAMANGDLQRAMMFSRMIPQLRGVKNEAEFLARYQKLVQAGWETEIELTKTLAGQLQQVSNVWGDVKERIGQVLSETLRPVIGTLKEAVAWVYMLPDGILKVATYSILLGAALLVLPHALNLASFAFKPLMQATTTFVAFTIRSFYGLSGILLSPYVLFSAGLLMIYEGLTGNISNYFGSLVGMVDQFKGTWTAFKDALYMGDFGSAWELVKATAKLAFLTMTRELRENWAGAVAVVYYYWQDVVTGLKTVWEKFTYSLGVGLSVSLKGAADVWYGVLYDIQTRIITGKFRLGIVSKEEGQAEINALNDEYAKFHQNRNEEFAKGEAQRLAASNKRILDIRKQDEEQKLNIKAEWEKDLTTVRKQTEDARTEVERIKADIGAKATISEMMNEAATPYKPKAWGMGEVKKGAVLGGGLGGGKEESSPQAVLASSVEAVSRVLAFRDKIGVDASKIDEKQLKEAEKSNDLLASIKRVIETPNEFSLGLT